MNVKEIASAIGYLPANLFSGFANILLGGSKREHGTIVRDDEGYAVITPSVLGLLTEIVKSIGSSLSDLIYEHKKAIAIAGWLSMAIGGGAALTLYLWPAALTAVATYAIYGYSIEAIVGTGVTAQIGFASGLAAAATSAITYLTDGVVNAISWLKACCRAPAPSADKSQMIPGNEKSDNIDSKPNPFNKLHRQTAFSLDTIPEEPPQSSALFTDASQLEVKTNNEPSQDPQQSTINPALAS
jgi:hypothetical protein